MSKFLFNLNFISSEVEVKKQNKTSEEKDIIFGHLKLNSSSTKETNENNLLYEYNNNINNCNINKNNNNSNINIKKDKPFNVKVQNFFKNELNKPKSIIKNDNNLKSKFNLYTKNLFQYYDRTSKIKHIPYKTGNNSNTIIKTDAPYSNSDNSISSGHNSSQRTVLFYEPKVKKFNSINEDLYKLKHLSLTSKKKNYFPKIVHNHYQSFNVSLSVRDENKRFFQYIENKKSRNQKQKQPIKLLSIDTESISDTLNSYSMSKTFKSFNKENIGTRPKIKFHSYREIPKLIPENINKKIPNFHSHQKIKNKIKKIKSNNNLLSKSVVLKKKKSCNKINHIYLTDSEIKSKNDKNRNDKTLKLFVINIKRRQNKKISQLSKISESNSTTKLIGNSSNKSIHKKYFSDDKIGKSSKSLLNESKITKNHSINGTENEKSSSDKTLIIKKKLSPKKLKVNDSNSPNNKQLKKKTNKRNNGFEIDISLKLNLINENRTLKKKTFLENVEKVIIHFKISHEKKIEHDFQNKFLNNKNKNIHEFIKDKKDSKHIKIFKKNYVNILCHQKFTVMPLNQYFIQNNFLEKYFIMHLYELIFIHKYFDFPDDSPSSIIDNFLIKDPPKKKSTIVFGQKGLYFDLNKNNGFFQNFVYVSLFCRKDFEFEFTTKPLKEQLEFSKRRASVIFNCLKCGKSQNNKFLGKTAWKYLIKKNMKLQNEKKETAKFSLFRNALKRNHFYLRKKSSLIKER